MDRSHDLLMALKEKRITIFSSETETLNVKSELYIETVRRFIKTIEISNKFDISEIQDLFDEDLAETALAANHENMLRPPFDICLFSSKTTVNNEDICILTVSDVAKRIEDLPSLDNYGKEYTERSARVFGSNGLLVVSFVRVDKKHWFLPSINGRICYGFSPEDCMFIVQPTHSKGTAIAPEDNVIDGTRTSMYMAALTMACLNARGTELVTQIPPPKLNAARVRRGKYPLQEYKIVKINPFRPTQSGSFQGGTHASPRLHLRRGHTRNFIDGSKTLVRSCWVGDSAIGVIKHDYIVKEPK